MKISKNEFLSINFLKAFAITEIVLFHIFPTSVPGGFLGVHLFFILSGFLEVISCDRKWNQGAFRLLKYYGNKLKRIYPPLLTMLSSILAFCTIFYPRFLTGIHRELISIVSGMNNWWQIHENSDYFTKMANQSMFTHLWFLSVLLQFYLFFPLFYLLLKTIQKRSKTICYGIIIFLLVGSVGASILLYFTKGITRVYYGTDTCLYSLLFGVLLGFIKKEKFLLRALVHQKLILLTGLFLQIILAILIHGEMSALYWGGLFIFSMLNIIWILSFVSYESINQGKLMKTWWFGNPLFQWIGKHSLTLYLWHYPFIYLFHVMR